MENYQDLRNEADFSDVTLVCEEQQIEAHKIILTASSPFFKGVLKKNKHSHPIIYMRGLKAKDLVAIVDFIYNGEAKIQQEDLEGFLALAEDLQLKGLARAEKKGEVLMENIPDHKKLKTMTLKTERNVKNLFEPTSAENNTTNWENTLVPVNKEKLMTESSTEDAMSVERQQSVELRNVLWPDTLKLTSKECLTPVSSVEKLPGPVML